MRSPAAGNHKNRSLTFTKPPERVVSLVPSITESLFDLGFGSSLVGITDFCIYPAAGVAKLPHLGGTKNPDLERILALKPDFVIANQEENTPETVDYLESRGLRVWVNFPKTVRQAVDVLWLLVGIYQSPAAALRLETLERALDWAASESSQRQPWRYFCPIWQQSEGENAWWMTFNQATYMHDLLQLFGGVNCFAGRQRLYPLEADLGRAAAEDAGQRDTRYPRLSLAEITAADPHVLLLPSEPYAYQVEDTARLAAQFSTTAAARLDNLFHLDGSLLTWHGTRLGKALTEFPAIFQQIKF